MFGRNFCRAAWRLFTKKTARTTLLVAPTILTGLYFSADEQARMMTDRVLEKAKGYITREIEVMKRKHGDQVMTFPQVNYSMDVGVYKIDYLIDQRKCDIFSLLVIASNLIQERESKSRNNPNPFVTVKTFKKDNMMTFQIEFKETGEYDVRHKGTISISGEWRNDRPSFKFILEKQADLSDEDLKIITETYLQANLSTPLSSERVKNLTQPKVQQSQQKEGTIQNFLSNVKKEITSQTQTGDAAKEDPIERLKALGVVVFSPDDKSYLEGLTWDILAGYESQKRDIEDTVLLSLTHSDIFDEITSQTRVRFEKNRAKAVLFEGPPGTGKTTSAKIIASQVGIPLLYLPLESVMSKWYGESEKKLADIFDAASKIGRAIVFIDEIDALALGRSEVLLFVT